MCLASEESHDFQTVMTIREVPLYLRPVTWRESVFGVREYVGFVRAICVSCADEAI